jgi:uncharacterized protein YrrD
MSSNLPWIVLAFVAVGVALLGLLRLAAHRAGRRSQSSTSTMRAHDLKGRAVLTISDATKVGEVDDVLFDASGRNVMAFRIRGGPIGHRAALERDRVAAVGPDAIMVSEASAVNDFKRLPALADALRLDKLRGTKVLTSGGELLGRVWDLEIDSDARRVVAYVLRGSLMLRLTNRRPVIPVGHVSHIGGAAIVVVGDTTATTA